MDEPWDILKFVTARFHVLGIEYMIVGSTAMRAYVPGRSTFDTDILVQMSIEQLAQLSDELGDDWYMDWDVAERALESRRMFNAIHYKTSWKLDIIPLKDNAFHRTEFARRRKESIGGIACYVQSLEDLILSKLEWAARGGSQRQIEDVRSLFRAQLPLNDAYLRKWAPELGIEALMKEARDG